MTTVTIINIIVIWALCIFIAGCIVTAGIIRADEPGYKYHPQEPAKNMSDGAATALFLLFVILSPILAGIVIVIFSKDMLRNGWMYSNYYKLGQQKEVEDE